MAPACQLSLDGCGFFNSIVIRLPFNPISDGTEWWLFWILVVILMWLCEEVSHIAYASILTRSEESSNSFVHFMMSDLQLFTPTPAHTAECSAVFDQKMAWPPCPMLPIHPLSPQATLLVVFPDEKNLQRKTFCQYRRDKAQRWQKH